MWYHVLLTAIGLYLVGTAIYNLVMNRNTTSYVTNGIQIVIGGFLFSWGYGGIRESGWWMGYPASVFSSTPTMGGRRLKKRS